MTDGDTPKSLTPDEVEKRARTLLPTDGTVEADEDIDMALTALLTPESRLRIIGALVEASNEPLTGSRLSDIAGVSKASFARHEDDLLEVGIMLEVDKVGNARRFALNDSHPAAQLLWMLDRVLTFGETSDALDDRFVFDETWEDVSDEGKAEIEDRKANDEFVPLERDSDE
mgnify:CR=1 FL=1|jgi:hypothetical protein